MKKLFILTLICNLTFTFAETDPANEDLSEIEVKSHTVSSKEGEKKPKKKKGPNLCEKRFIKAGYGYDKDVCKTTSWSRRHFMNLKWDKYFQCREDAKVITESDWTHRYCNTDNKIDSISNKHLSTCIDEFKPYFGKTQTLMYCQNNINLADNIEDNDYIECRDSLKHLGEIDSRLLCIDTWNQPEYDDEEYVSCIEKGLKGTKYNYYAYKAMTTVKESPFKYLIKDCNSDTGFFGPPEKKENKYFNFYQDFNINTLSPDNNNLKFGGFSAIRFDTENKNMFVLSDDRGVYGAVRVLKFDYNFDEKNNFDFSESNHIHLEKQIAMDPEGLDITAEGNLIISSEMDDLAGDDFITTYNLSGKKLSSIPIHEDYKPESKTTKDCNVQTTNYLFYSVKKNVCKVFTDVKGFQPNKSLESLTLTPNKDFMFIANEQALHQDRRYKKSFGGKKSEIVDHIRIAKYGKNEAGNFQELAQYYYNLEDKPDNGVVDVLAFDETRLLVLERSWDSFKKRITAQIFFVDLNSGDNILVDNKDFKAKALTKTHLIDLYDIKDELSPGFRILDNFEGMAFGPKLPNGKDSIVLVADNNFRLSQRSIILILEIDKEAILNIK